MFILGDDFLGKSCVNSAKKLQLLFLNSEIWRLYQLRLAETASPSQNYVNSMSVLSKIQAILTGALSIFEINTGVCVCVCVKRGWKEDAVFLLNWTLRLFGDLFWIAKIERTTLLPKFRGGMKRQKPKGDSTLLQHHVQFQDPLHAWNLQLLASSGGLPTSARCPSHQDIFK